MWIVNDFIDNCIDYQWLFKKENFHFLNLVFQTIIWFFFCSFQTKPGLTLTLSEFLNGRLRCFFTRDKTVSGFPTLGSNNSYFILLAHGPVINGGKVTRWLIFEKLVLGETGAIWTLGYNEIMALQKNLLSKLDEKSLCTNPSDAVFICTIAQ